MTREYRIEVELREPEPWEKDASCNGCHSPEVARVFDIGSRSTDDRGGGNGSTFRLCPTCVDELKRAVAAADSAS